MLILVGHGLYIGVAAGLDSLNKEAWPDLIVGEGHRELKSKSGEDKIKIYRVETSIDLMVFQVS